MQRITGNENMENTMNKVKKKCPCKKEAEQKKVYLRCRK